MRYCPPCRRYVSGAAFSCAGCGASATKLPYVGPDEPLTRRQPPPRVEIPAPVPVRVLALHAAPPARRARAGGLAPALLAAGLGFAGLCAVAGSAAPGGTASAQGAAAPALGGGPGLSGGDAPVLPVTGAGPTDPANLGIPSTPGTAPHPAATPSSRPTRIDDTAAVAVVAPAPTTSTAGFATSLVALPPAATPTVVPSTPVSVTPPTSATPTPSAPAPTPRSAPTSVAAASSPSCLVDLLGLCVR